ncbi:hypothetical protein Cadr_000021279 [Camelus dromedarius]|uniref:Uncharacterized protein n=1 Tax=Camelus dromedarius TaxID=9838 RepID=A0A5N4CTL6_CAMDR|nr:hypothetical protein Cadr_000021279 [Camelus dromedarius]
MAVGQGSGHSLWEKARARFSRTSSLVLSKSGGEGWASLGRSPPPQGVGLTGWDPPSWRGSGSPPGGGRTRGRRGWGEALGIGACAVLRVSLGVLAPAGGLGTGQMEGRGGVAGKDHPPPLAPGSKQGAGHPTLQSFWIRGGEASTLEATPSPPLLRALAAEKLAWEEVPALRSSGSQAKGHLAPLGPLCSEGGQATEGVCQLWAGAGSRELLSWLRSLGKSLVLAALVGIALSKRKKPGQPFLFALFHTPGFMVHWELIAAIPVPWLPDSQGSPWKKWALPGRCPRGPDLAPWGQGEGEGPADRLLSPSTLSCQTPRPGEGKLLLTRAKVLSGLQLLASHLDLPPRRHTVRSEQAQDTSWRKPTLECEVEYRPSCLAVLDIQRDSQPDAPHSPPPCWPTAPPALPKLPRWPLPSRSEHPRSGAGRASFPSVVHSRCRGVSSRLPVAGDELPHSTDLRGAELGGGHGRGRGRGGGGGGPAFHAEVCGPCGEGEGGCLPEITLHMCSHYSAGRVRSNEGPIFGLRGRRTLTPAPWHSSHLRCFLRTVRPPSLWSPERLWVGPGGRHSYVCYSTPTSRLPWEMVFKMPPVGDDSMPPRGTGVGNTEGQEKQHLWMLRQGRSFSPTGEEQERGQLPCLVGYGTEAGAEAARPTTSHRRGTRGAGGGRRGELMLLGESGVGVRGADRLGQDPEVLSREITSPFLTEPLSGCVLGPPGWLLSAFPEQLHGVGHGLGARRARLCHSQAQTPVAEDIQTGSNILGEMVEI